MFAVVLQRLCILIYVLRDISHSRHGRELAMRFHEIQNMAKGMGIKKYNNMKKIDLIRATQRPENNIACYGTQRVDSC